MLIRITKNSEGIEDYFESGHKKGRDLSRDELDRRVHLAGNIDAFGVAVEYTMKNKKWQNNYYHLTASFAFENNDLDDDTLRKITSDMLEYYFCDYKVDDLIVAAEAHRPLMQSEVNKSNGAINQRLLHLHLAVSMLDIYTDNQLRMIPYKHEADKAFQSMMAEKYNLIDPATRKREIKQTKKDIIARWNSNANVTAKQTKVAELRAIFSDVLDGSVSTIDDAINLLNELDIVSKVEFKKQKSGNNYLQVKTTIATKNINLRGKGFESIEKLYYSIDELNEREQQGKYKAKVCISNDDLVNDHKAWWLDQQQKRKPKNKINYEQVEKKYDRKFKDSIKEAKVYYVFYKNNIEEALITGYRIWEKNNTKYLFNNDLGVKIYDSANKITAQIPDDPQIRIKTLQLMLEMATAKGWDIKKMTVTGCAEFKQEVERQVKLIQLDKVDHLDIRRPGIEKVYVPRLSAVTQAVFSRTEIEAKKKLTKQEVEAIKNELDAQLVIDYAVTHYGLIKDHFSVVGNKISDDRIKVKQKNVIDFLTKTCNFSFGDALPLLHKLLVNEQRSMEPIEHELSICKDIY